MTVLLVGGRTAAALFLARRLSMAGARVIATDCYPGAVLGFSRHVARLVRSPSPRLAPTAFANALRALAGEERVDHVVATGEEVFAVARIADTLTGRVWAGPLDALLALHDKAAFAARVAALAVPGIRAPQTWVEGPFPRGPAIIKPRTGRFGQGVRVIPSGQMPDPDPDALVQEFVAGDERCSFAWARDGEIVAHVVYRPVVRFSRGPGIALERSEAPALASLAEAVAKPLRWSGALAFDAIVEKDGTVVPIECNPRLTLGVHFLPGLAAVLLGQRASAAPEGEAFMMALGAYTAGLRHATSLRNWWRAVRVARDVFWDSRDPLPSLMQLATVPYLWSLARRERISLSEAATWWTRP